MFLYEALLQTSHVPQNRLDCTFYSTEKVTWLSRGNSWLQHEPQNFRHPLKNQTRPFIFANVTPGADKLLNFRSNRRSRLVLRKSHNKLPPRCPISWDRVHPVHRKRSHRAQNSLLSGTLAGQLAHSHLHTEIESEKIASFKKSFTVKCC